MAVEIRRVELGGIGRKVAKIGGFLGFFAGNAGIGQFRTKWAEKWLIEWG
jgi:hypothetical protein